jgi:hypothetical protein
MGQRQHEMNVTAPEQAKHQSALGGTFNVPMEDSSDSDDNDYHDPMSDEHEVGGSSSGGVANKEMDDDPPTTKTFANQAPTPVPVQHPSELGQILSRLVAGQEHNQKRMERQERDLKSSIDKQA